MQQCHIATESSIHSDFGRTKPKCSISSMATKCFSRWATKACAGQSRRSSSVFRLGSGRALSARRAPTLAGAGSLACYRARFWLSISRRQRRTAAGCPLPALGGDRPLIPCGAWPHCRSLESLERHKIAFRSAAAAASHYTKPHHLRHAVRLGPEKTFRFSSSAMIHRGRRRRERPQSKAPGQKPGA